MIRVLVADDQAMIRGALVATLALEDDIEVVGEAGSCAETLAVASRRRPDVVLLDVQMPSGGAAATDGIELVPDLLRQVPSARVIVVTTFGRPGYLRRALESGAVGFMVKDAPVERLIEGVRRVAAGLRVVDPELAAASLTMGASPLTEKEAEILALVADGLTGADVAERLFLSEGTVRNYLSSAMLKLGARNRTEAARAARDNGWL